ncbi:MAG: BamA/TamA family outer membrane protein, partial [Candidatus Eremiobacteraeota bacterium]|nr:BamA/TamA family outer membrane protein [Candidatus Eremiobacteraeota bacterium]
MRRRFRLAFAIWMVITLGGAGMVWAQESDPGDPADAVREALSTAGRAVDVVAQSPEAEEAPVKTFRVSGKVIGLSDESLAVEARDQKTHEFKLTGAAPDGVQEGSQVTVFFTVGEGGEFVANQVAPLTGEAPADELPTTTAAAPAPAPASEGDGQEGPPPGAAPEVDTTPTERQAPRIVNIEVEGNTQIPDEEILQVVSTRIGDPLLEPRIRRDMQAIFDLGYFTDVRLDTPLAPGGLRLIFRVLENPEVKTVAIEGNEVVETSKLLELMKTKPGKILNTRTVHSDIQNINKYYNEDLGYLLSPTHVTNLTFEDGVLTLSVRDGIVVSKVNIEGVTVYPEEKVASLVRVRPGELFNQKTLDEDLAKIAELYEKDQWVLETVAPTVNPETGEVSLRVLEATVEEIRVEGNIKTKTDTVLRNLRTKPGQVLNRRKFQKDLERLNNLGYFKKVDPSPQPGTEPGKLILVLDVEEQKTGLATIGIGYAGGGAGGVRAGVTGAISFSDRNLFGEGKSASIQWQRGAQISSIGASYFDPAINDNQDSIGVSLFRNEVDSLRQPVLINGVQEFAFYDDRRYGGSVTYGHPLTDDLRVFGTVRHETIEILQSSGSTFTPVGLGKGTLNALGASALYDTRDDIFNPHVGSYANGAVNVAGFGGDFNFTKYTIEGRHYVPLGDNHTIALRGWAGVLSGDAPISEFFFAGGPDTLRGYQQNQFFGTRFLVGNAEYRFPLGNIKFLRGAVFVDAGNAWTPGDYNDGKIYVDGGVGLRITFPALGLG